MEHKHTVHCSNINFEFNQEHEYFPGYREEIINLFTDCQVVTFIQWINNKTYQGNHSRKFRWLLMVEKMW